MKVQLRGALVIVGSILLSAVAPMAIAADITYDAATTISLGSLSLTIGAGSTASSVVVDGGSMTVTTGASDSMTITGAANRQLTSIPSKTYTCNATAATMTIGASETVTITPTANVCDVGGGNPAPAASPAATPAAPATPATPTVAPAVPATPATPAVKVVTDLPPIKGAIEVQEVTLPTNGKIAAKTNLVNATGDTSIELSKNVKLTGLKAGQTLRAPVETDPATVSTLKASTLKKKSVVAAFDLDTDAVKSSKTVKMQVALGAMTDTKGLKVYLLDETTGKTKTLLGSYNKKTNVFTARTKYLGGYTLVFTLPVPAVKK